MRKEIDGQTNRKTDRDRQKDRQTDRQTDKQRQTERQKGRKVVASKEGRKEVKNRREMTEKTKKSRPTK